jgi:hypothetical protein
MKEKNQIKKMRISICHLTSQKEKTQYIIRVFGGDPRMSNSAIQTVIEEILNTKLGKKENNDNKGDKKTQYRQILPRTKKD